MTGAGAHLSLRPERCDQCGRCERACSADAIKVGPSYLYVDWHACDGCNACVEACDRGAIERAVVSKRAMASAPLAPDAVSKVVVGSRAEAKAVRKAAEQAAKAQAKGGVTYAPKADKTAAEIAAQVSARSGGSAAATASPAPRPRVAVAGVSAGGPPPGAVSWTLVDLGVTLAVVLVTVLVKDLVFGLRAVGLMPVEGRMLVRGAVLVAFYCLQLAAFSWLASRHHARLLPAFGLRRADGAPDTSDTSPSAIGSAGLVLLLFAGTETFAIVYGLAMRAAGFVRPEQLNVDLGVLFGTGWWGVALSVALVAFVAPFAEELAFRGIVLPVLGARWGAWPAVVTSAAVFAAYHFSAWMFAPTFVLGVALAWLAWTRRSLWPAICLHVLYNGAAVAASYLLVR